MIAFVLCWGRCHDSAPAVGLALALGCGPGGNETDAAGAGTIGVTGTNGGSASGTAAASNSDTGVASGTEAASTTGGGAKLDVGSDPGGETEGQCDCGSQLEFSYIWVANTDQSTISKINTQTIVEEGRYLTRPDAAGSPSRTSVSLSGRAVAVANRAGPTGGVTKVWARPEFCDGLTNSQPGVQTSTGAGDVLAWGEDDCVAWHTPFDYATQRPIAWVAGTQNPATCDYEDEMVWTAGCDPDNNANVQVHRLDGADGSVIDSVDVIGFACFGLGAYGGAADGDGNFWITNNEEPTTLARIDAVTLQVQTWTVPLRGYGMTVDHAGRPWVTANRAGTVPASAARFDPTTQTWDLATNRVAKGYTGIAQDASGRMWMNYAIFDGVARTGVVSIDVETMEVGVPFDIPTVQLFPEEWLNGVSIDLDQHVWVLCPPCDTAFRYDPGRGELNSYAGLAFPYTYSDMTGFALQNAACTPAG